MKVSELWLRNLIKLPFTVTEIAEQLTQGGIEVDHLAYGEPPKNNGILTLKVPPNRGDCLSMEGIARELSVLNNSTYQPIVITPFPAELPDTLPIKVEAEELCPRYVGCMIKNIHHTQATPAWIQDRLIAVDIRPVSTLVDITNYVMLELGQPLHAFDVEKLDQEIIVRHAKASEQAVLLDNQTITLSAGTLVIADKSGIQAIAGVMGGLNTAISDTTTAIWLESAYFDPVAVRLAAKQYGLRTDASYRFERGVDPALQKRALDRALHLISEITGGMAGPIVEKVSEQYLPKIPLIQLRSSRIHKILGVELESHAVANILATLGMQSKTLAQAFNVSPPSFRSDIRLEIDVIEEIVRVYGLNRLPSQSLVATLTPFPIPETKISAQLFKELLVNRGYSEAITYSFIDPKMLDIFKYHANPLVVMNPITTDMAAMRVSLLPGLVQTLQYNQRRQNMRAAFFEMGTCFIEQEGKLQEKQMLSGITAGAVYPEQWSNKVRLKDFYDVKGDVEAILAMNQGTAFTFTKAIHPSLHPGQSAAIQQGDTIIGYIGSLHPHIIKSLELEGPVIAFELEMAYLQTARISAFCAISKFPAIRRDIALLVDKSLEVSELQRVIVECAGNLLQKVIWFDVYHGKGIAVDKKSIAFGLILQHPTRTLIETEINQVVQMVINRLADRFKAVLRE